MRLEALELQNYRRFRSARIEFPDGILGLVGRNGSGKSTFIEAIGWALFGHDAARTGKDLLKRRGAGPGEDVRVRLAFRFGGHTYDVTRELRGKNASHVASLVVDGTVVVPPGAKSESAVTEYLERVFHMDRESFFTSLVARQKELNALSDMRPGDRKAVVLRMLRIDAVDGAIQRAREAKRDLKREAETLAATLIPETELAAREARLVTERAECARKVMAQEDALLHAQAAADTARAVREAEEGKAQAYGRVQERLARVRERAVQVGTNLVKKRAELKDIETRVAERATLEPDALAYPGVKETFDALTVKRERAAAAARELAELERARKGMDTLTASLAQAEERVQARTPARSALKRLREFKDRHQAKIGELEKNRGEASALARNANLEAERIQRRKSDLAGLGAETPCPTCTRPLGEHFGDVVGHLDAEVVAKREEARTHQERAEFLYRELEGLQRDLRDLAEREAELQAKVDELTRAEADRASLLSRIDAERARLARLEKAVGSIALEPVDEKAYADLKARLATVTRIRERYLALEGHAARKRDVEETVALLVDDEARVREELTAAEAEAAAIGFDRAAHQRAIKASDDAQAALGLAKVALERARGEGKRLEDEALRLAADRERNAGAAARVQHLRSEAGLLERLAGDRDGGLLVAFKHALIGRVRPALSDRAGALYRDLTDGRYAGMELDEDYEILIHDEGETFGLERFSGGEADLANLCLRLAIGQVLAEQAGGTEFSFLALDEIFGSQDDVRKGNILRALSHLSNQFRQILVVTHVDDIKEAVDHVVRVVERADGTSELELS